MFSNLFNRAWHTHVRVNARPVAVFLRPRWTATSTEHKFQINSELRDAAYISGSMAEFHRISARRHFLLSAGFTTAGMFCAAVSLRALADSSPLLMLSTSAMVTGFLFSDDWSSARRLHRQYSSDWMEILKDLGERGPDAMSRYSALFIRDPHIHSRFPRSCEKP